MNHKFTALDSVRGVAAVMVIFQHFWEMNHSPDARFKPWLFFCAGHEAVILFFILSGFVLSHQLRDFNFSYYPTFICKRALRIYPAYYAALGLSIIMLLYISHFYPSPLKHNGLSPWFYIWLQTRFDQTLVWGSMTLISHQGNSLNVAVWTLFYEVWLSLIFPLLLWLLFKSYSLISILMVSFMLAISYWLWLNGLLLDNPWAAILYYTWYFVIGMLIYQYHPYLAGFSGTVCLGLGLILYFSNYLLFGKISSRLVHEVIIANGSCLLIINCLYNNRLKAALNFWLFRFLGRISYSMYLLHLPVLYSLSYLFLHSYSVMQVKMMTLFLTVILASVCYYWVELLFMRFAVNISVKVKN